MSVICSLHSKIHGLRGFASLTPAFEPSRTRSTTSRFHWAHVPPCHPTCHSHAVTGMLCLHMPMMQRTHQLELIDRQRNAELQAMEGALGGASPTT